VILEIMIVIATPGTSNYLLTKNILISCRNSNSPIGVWPLLSLAVCQIKSRHGKLLRQPTPDVQLIRQQGNGQTFTKLRPNPNQRQTEPVVELPCRGYVVGRTFRGRGLPTIRSAQGGREDGRIFVSSCKMTRRSRYRRVHESDGAWPVGPRTFNASSGGSHARVFYFSDATRPTYLIYSV
jgi:hypothetical protein